jgi:hypothetical protein
MTSAARNGNALLKKSVKQIERMVKLLTLVYG